MIKRLMKNKFEIEKLNQYVKLGKFTVEKHQDDDIYIYGYSQIDSNSHNRIKWDDFNINMRGLIVDSDGNVLSRAFQKFFTYKNYVSEDTILLSENQIQKIKTNNFRIFEKVDGTFTILYWIKDTPYLATQRSFKSPKAKKATEILHKKYKHTFDKLNRKKTYIFEAIYPETRVLVDYGEEEKLYLLGILDTETGNEEELVNIGFPIAKEYTQDFSYIKNIEDIKQLNLPNMEGFVLKYKDGLRIKVKFPWYERAHKVFNQIIAYKNASYQLEEQLKTILNIPKRKLTRKELWEHFENNGTISDIEKNIPDPLYSLGIEEWIKNEYDSFLSFTKQNNLSDIGSLKNDICFDFDSKIDLPESESVVWNRINRIIMSYS
ncbi:RNA ligase [Tenacibaculum sp. TC6]|uniref:RNA ligase n=1 Tax=Tenacibaculum sp. TC6 TaxID=3423223 RepID=UPI003D36A1EE